MDATKGNIYAILNGNKQFLIPVYQRYYSWETEQCSRLWNDIVDMQKKDKVGHFVGSIVNIAEQAMPTGVQKYMIIDGQQRLTTLSLLLIALRDYAEEHPEDAEKSAGAVHLRCRRPGGGEQQRRPPGLPGFRGRGDGECVPEALSRCPPRGAERDEQGGSVRRCPPLAGTAGIKASQTK